MGSVSWRKLFLRKVTAATTGNKTIRTQRNSDSSSIIDSCAPTADAANAHMTAGAASFQSTNPLRIKRAVENVVPTIEESLLVPMAKCAGRPHIK